VGVIGKEGGKVVEGKVKFKERKMDRWKEDGRNTTT
jgi:hypothetical protein